MVLIILSLLIYLLYNVFLFKLFGFLPSISGSTYKLDERYPGTPAKYLFTLFCWGAGFLLMPAWFDLTPDRWQFFVFLSCAGLLLVGASPNFQDGMEGRVHYVSAGFCVGMALLWCLIVAGTWYIVLASFAVFMIQAYRDKKWIYWIEQAAFFAAYISVFLLVGRSVG